MLEKMFKLKENNTTAKTEVIAGIIGIEINVLVESPIYRLLYACAYLGCR